MTPRRASGPALLSDTPYEQTAWMSRRDAVTVEPAGFGVTARGMLGDGEPGRVERAFRQQLEIPLVHILAEDRFAG